MYEEILYQVDEPVAVITLHRPDKLNAWTNQMDREVRLALQQAEDDERVVGIILTGAGRAFCAGADMSMLEAVLQSQDGLDEPQQHDDPGDDTMNRGFRQHYSYIASIRKPVIAAINGACVGMAVPIVCYCDLRFASENASFVTAFARRGLIAEWGTSWMLPRLVGMAHALDLMLSSRKVEAAEAERMGLVNRVLPADALIDHARSYIKELAAHCSPRSMSVMKRQFHQHSLTDIDTALDESFALMMKSFQGPDFQEGVASFLEKRPPNFPRLTSS